MKILVCGGRDYRNSEALFFVLDAVDRQQMVTEVIEGGARGADELAGWWAAQRGKALTVVRAEWWKYGSFAGPIRNRRMLELKPDLVVAFPGGMGTAHMKKIALEAGVEVFEPRLTPV